MSVAHQGERARCARFGLVSIVGQGWSVDVRHRDRLIDPGALVARLRALLLETSAPVFVIGAGCGVLAAVAVFLALGAIVR